MDGRDWPFPDKFHLRWRVSSASVRFATVLVVQTVISKSVMCITSLLLVDRLATCVISAIRPPYATTALLVSRGQTHPCVKLGLSLLRGVALTSCCGIEY